MRRSIFGRSLCFALLLAAPVGAEQIRHPLRSDLPEIREAVATQAARPSFDGALVLRDFGQPQLPVERLVFLIPRDQSVAGVSVLGGRLRSLGRPAQLAKDAGEPVSGQPLLREIVFDPALVAASEFYPPLAARWLGEQFEHGYRLASVEVYPLRVDQATGELWLHSGGELVLDLAPAPSEQTIAHRERDLPGWRKEVERKLRARVANPQAIDGYALPPVLSAFGNAAADASKTPSLGTSPVRMVIITSSSLTSEFQRLADHRTKLGLPALVVTIDQILANYRQGLDLQESIRLFIQDAYSKWGVDFVLLGGDSNVMAPRYVTSTFYPPGKTTDIPADLYFACLDGNWNADGDGIFGDVFVSGADPGDNVDLVPELSVGRAPVSTLAEAEIFVDKVIEWEIPTNVGYQTNALLASEVLFPDDWSQGQSIQLDGATFSESLIADSFSCTPDWSSTRYYENYTAYPGSSPEIKQDIQNAMNSGQYGVFNHVGHGFYFNMSVGSGNLIVSDTGNLSNGPNYYLLYALNCSSAAFDFSCISERILQSDSGGSVASIGSVRSAFPNAANNYQQAFYAAALCSTTLRVGAAIDQSRLVGTGNTFFNTSDRWTHFCYVLLGDPALQLWSKTPRTVSIAAPASAALGDNNLTITVTDVALAGPMAGATVTLSKNGEDFATGTTNVSGQVTLPFHVETGGAVTVWVSGNNAYPASANIPVQATAGSFLSVQSLSFDDDSSGGSIGNGNGRLEAGERIQLLPLVRNSGNTPFAGGTIQLSESDPYLSLVGANVALGAVPAGGSAFPAAPLSFDIDEQIPDSHEASLSFALSDGGLGNWSDVEIVLFAGSQIEVFALRFDDTGSGNGNGVVDNGETVSLIVTLKNYGSGAVGSVSGVLNSIDPDVTIIDGAASFGAMPEVLDTVDNNADRFSVTESVVSPVNKYSLTLTDDSGRVLVVSLDLVKPNAVAGLTQSIAAGGELAIRWTKNAAADLLGYKVYRRPVGGLNYSLASPDIVVGSATFREAGLPPLTSFEYAVAALDSGRLEGALSAPIVASTPPAEIGCFPLPMGQETSSDLAITHLEGDGVPDMVIGTELVYVIDGNCQEKLDGDNDAQSFGPISGVAGKYGPASIAIGNMNADYDMEIVASSWGTKEIYVFDAMGNILPGWPVSPLYTNWGTPAIGDLDEDGDNEFVFVDTGGYINAFHHDGTEVADGDANGATLGPVAPRRVGESFGRISPALFDVDGDGKPELLFGSKFSSNSISDVFYALKADGSGANAAGWPKTIGIRSEFLASPTVADIDDDGVWEIIAICENDSLYVWHPNGTRQPNFPKRFVSQSVNRDSLAPSPAVGDFTGDGKLEMVIVETVSATSSRVNLVNYLGNVLPGWPVTVPNLSECSPVVGDIDGDGQLDIVWGIGGGSDSAPNFLYAWNKSGVAITGFPIFMSGFVRSTPTLTDFDLDGNINLALASWDRQIHVWDLAAPYDPLLVPFPTFRGNNLRDGVYRPRELTPAPEYPLRKSAMFLPNVPNPFNPATSLIFEIPAGGAAQVELAIFDGAGRRIRTLSAGALPEGRHQMRWNGTDDAGFSVSSGVYYAQLRVDAQPRLMRKIALVK